MREINVEPIRAVERTIQILNCFNFERPNLSIEEIVKSTGLPKATTYRLLWTLEKNGLIQYDPKENVYRLGYKLLEYGGIVLENLDIRREAEPFLAKLHEETGHTVLLAVRQQETIQYLLRYDSDDGFQPRSYVGRRRVLNYGALGIVIMAYMPDEEAREIVRLHPLEAHTPHTVTDESQFFARLQQIRKQGYFIDVDETFVGFTAVTAPVYGSKGEAVAAIGVAGPSFKMKGENLTKIIKLTVGTGLNISERLGYVNTRTYSINT